MRISQRWMLEVLVGPASGSFTALSLYQDIFCARCFLRERSLLRIQELKDSRTQALKHSRIQEFKNSRIADWPVAASPLDFLSARVLESLSSEYFASLTRRSRD